MSRPRQFDLVVFDWDGTLYDSTALIARCIQAACADLDQTVPSLRDASYVIGMGLVEALRFAAPGLPENRYPELSARYLHHYSARKDELTLFEGTLSMLASLKARRYLLGVATGKSRRGLDDVLASVELRGMFDATRTADETHSKPHPRMLRELMEALDVTPERTLMVGDTTHDLELAMNAGAASVGVSYGAHSHESFGEFKPRFVAHSVAELDTWLAAHG